ncbi:glycosyltransferase family 4 protein [Phosphitispora sp. TUW77]|uniref:glycosyltransferase family 4 protein n=1 Tax=Phosphitispora sp. TUW77 TaxID=3152361 RepID=UPI003AB4A446
MRILYVLNKLTHTSIPLEMANKISHDAEITVISLYDSLKSAEGIAKVVAPKCNIIACDGQKNIILGLLKLHDNIKKSQYEVIHTHQTLSGAWARWVAKDNKSSIIIHTVHANHNSFSLCQNLIIGYTLKYCDAIVGNSQSTLDGLKSWQKKKIKNIPRTVIYNGVDSKVIQNAKSEKSDIVMQQFEISYDEFLFGLVGRFVKVKNHENVLEAFERFLKSAPKEKKYRLLLVGDGPEKSKIKYLIQSSELLKKHVVMTGLLPKDYVYSLLHRFDAFIMASFHEGFCNALMEALVLGVPAMISRIQVFMELFENEDILTFDPYNIEEIQKCMNDIVIHEKKKNMDINKLRERYDLSVSVEKYLELYRLIVYSS